MDRDAASRGAVGGPARPGAGRLALALSAALLCTACDPDAFDKFTRGEDKSAAGSGAEPSPDAEIDTGPPEAGEDEEPSRGGDASVEDAQASGARPSDAGQDAEGTGGDARVEPAREAGVDSGGPAQPMLDDCGQMRPTDPKQFGIADGGVTFAPVAQHASLDGRPASAVVRYADKLLWIFGNDPMTLTSSSYAISSVDRPYELSEAQPGGAVRGGLIPDVASDATLLMSGEKLAYLTGNVVRSGSKALLFYGARAVVNYSVRDLGTRVAELSFDGETARVVVAQQPLAPPERSYLWGLHVDGQVYLYACTQPTVDSFVCFLSRAPFASATSRAAFEYWTANGWSKDAAAVAPVFTGAHGEISVSYNPYLRRYLAAHLVWIIPEIRLLSAERPEGPWVPFATIDVPVADGDGWHLTAQEHPDLARSCGRQLSLTYSHTLAPGSGHQLRRIDVRLR